MNTWKCTAVAQLQNQWILLSTHMYISTVSVHHMRSMTNQVQACDKNRALHVFIGSHVHSKISCNSVCACQTLSFTCGKHALTCLYRSYLLHNVRISNWISCHSDTFINTTCIYLRVKDGGVRESQNDRYNNWNWGPILDSNCPHTHAHAHNTHSHIHTCNTSVSESTNCTSYKCPK